MTTFAIFYEQGDLAQITANVQAIGAGSFVGLTNTDKTNATRLWNAGLKNWATAPLGQSPYEQPGSCPTCRQLVISGTQVNLQMLRDLLYKVCRLPSSTVDMQYLCALADDMGGTSGAVEPWTG